MRGENQALVHIDEVPFIEVPTEILATTEDLEFEKEFEDGLNNVFDSLKEATVEQGKMEKTVTSEAKDLTDSMLYGFETTIQSLKISHTKAVNLLLEKQKTNTLDEHELEALRASISNLQGINQLETNELLFKYLSNLTSNESSLQNEELGNKYKLRKALDKLEHTARRIKIGKANIKSLYTLVDSLPEGSVFKIKVITYLRLFADSMNSVGKEEAYAFRHYVVFLVGLMRISIQSHTTFINMERAFCNVYKVPVGSDMFPKDYTKIKSNIAEKNKVEPVVEVS